MSNNNGNIPEAFKCPITQDLMEEPVIAKDGQTYEKRAILEWLSINRTSPFTRVPMSSNDLTVNYALKTLIQDWKSSGILPTIHSNPTQVVSAAGAPIKQVTKSKELSIQIQSASGVEPGTKIVNLSLTPPSAGDLQQSVYIAIIDVSGSMDEEATLKESGTENSGLSKLDLVKHCMRTTIETLKSNDYLSVVSFTDNAKIELPITQMSSNGKTRANSCIESLTPLNSTNIWDGLKKGMELAKDPICENKNVFLVLLTDGVPNINPPRGLVNTLKEHLNGLQHLQNFSIHTFGFGYNLDSQVLREIASLGTGCYAYIPDCSMVGTIFVNFLAYISAILYHRVSIKIEGAQKVFGNPNNVLGKEFQIGAIQYGQSRSVVFQVADSTQKVKISLKFDSNKKEIEHSFENQETPSDLSGLWTEYFRSYFVDEILKAYDQTKLSSDASKGKVLVDKVYETISSSQYCSDERISAILRDIKSTDDSEGQVGKAFEKQEWFNKWGVHYIPSIVKAHQFQFCNNFRDPGVQVYGGEYFKNTQKTAEQVFCDLPAPKPSRIQRTSYYSSSSSSTYTYSAPSMSSYMNSGGVCFDGEGMVKLFNGGSKKVKELKRGDQVFCPSSSNPATVYILIETKVGKEILLCEINGVKLTPWHPVNLEGKWQFPADIVQPKLEYIDSIYNLVAKDGVSISINGLEVVSLGHNNNENSVLAHPYFATDKVVKDLEKANPDKDGKVVSGYDSMKISRSAGFIQSVEF